MSTRPLKDGDESFDVTVLEATEPARAVLFAVGGGGNPERHLPLLTALAGAGCTVVAPHFERLVSPEPTDAARSGCAQDAGWPILAWAGTRDVVTPPDQAELLARALGERVPVEVRVEEGAGHSSFMNTPPPQTVEPLDDREAFLAKLEAEVRRFVMRPEGGATGARP